MSDAPEPIRVLCEQTANGVRLEIFFPTEALAQVTKPPTHAEINPSGGISLDFIQDKGWADDETYNISAESVAMTLLRFARVAAMLEIER